MSSKWKKHIPWLAVGFVAATVIICGIRFFTYSPEHIHYHANFAIYINGQQEKFANPGLYEESGAACSEEAEQMTPLERAHMHDNINNVVHVEDQAVTWGQFFTNLGWVVDAKVIGAPNQTLLPDTDNKISFILNGQTMDNVSNRVIGDEDRLLIDFGNTPEDNLQTEFKNVASTAHQYDIGKDPKSCGSNAAPTMHDRMKHMF